MDLLGTPLKLFLEIRLDHIRIQRTKARETRKGRVEMNEALYDNISLVDAVGAISSLAVDESIVGSSIVVTDEPLRGILRYGAKEEGNTETLSDFVFLKLDAGGPVVHSKVRATWVRIFKNRYEQGDDE